jgi:hypothetical protein
MFAKNKIVGVNGGALSFAGSESVGMTARAPRRIDLAGKTQVTAGMAGMAGTGGASMSVNSFFQSSYQYYMTGILPADPHLIDTSTLALFYRDIYLFDNTAGSAVDIQSTFPFSDWELRGLPEKELEPFNTALERLSLKTMMPFLSTAYLTDGFFCGSLIFDPRSKQFIDTLIHDALSVAAIPSPFYNIDPTINVRVGQAAQQFMHDTSEYARRYLDAMPRDFIEMLKSGAFTLDPVTTMFIPRRSTTDRAYTSYLHRILPMYMIEKTLFRGTLVEAQRRQRAMTHLTAGDDVWTPSPGELQALVGAFQEAEMDPSGGWVATRGSVASNDLRPGGDFWKWTDMADVLVPYKLRALGISESFLSGESSYAAAESAYSTFLESMNAYRTGLTERVFYSKLFPLISVVNNLYKEGSNKARAGKIVEFLFNKSNRSNLKMPQLHWHKELEAKGEENMAELLETASQKGIPIPLRMWAAAAHIDMDSLLRELKEDSTLRKELEQYTHKDTSHDGEGDIPDQGHEFDDDDEGVDARAETSASLFPRIQQKGRVIPGLPTQSLVHGHPSYKQPLLGRDFGDSGDNFGLTKTGKIKYIPNSRNINKQMNDNILKIASKADKDPHYREQLRRRNYEKLGRTTLK